MSEEKEKKELLAEKVNLQKRMKVRREERSERLCLYRMNLTRFVQAAVF